MQVRKRKRRRVAAPIGGIFVILALVGAVTVIVTSLDLTARVLDNASTRTELENIIRPVMMFDPVPFESPQDISPQNLLLYSTWATLTSERRFSYVYDSTGHLRIPASDLNVAAAELFGSDIVLEHQTFDDLTTTYYFDAENMVYNIPISAELFDIYSPIVTSIERAGGDIYHVIVGYIPPVGAWSIDFLGNTSSPQPEKYMLYVMRRVPGGGFQIVALRDLQHTHLVFEGGQR